MTVHEATYRRSAVRRRVRGALRITAAMEFAFALALSLPPLIQPDRWGESLMVATVVIGGWIPTSQELATACLVSACSALVAARVVAEPRRDTPVRLALSNTSFGLAIPVTLCIAFISWLGSSEFSTLSETSPGGCRVVVRDHGFLNRGYSQVGVLQPGSVHPSWTRYSYTWDGRSPFRGGGYELDWPDRTADLTITDAIGTGSAADLPQCVR